MWIAPTRGSMPSYGFCTQKCWPWFEVQWQKTKISGSPHGVPLGCVLQSRVGNVQYFTKRATLTRSEVPKYGSTAS